jgi:hypothetical protein
MKSYLLPSLILLCFGVFAIASCEILPEENDECDQTKMPDVKEPVLIIKVLLLNDTIQGDTAHIARKALTGLFTGTVTKVYCDGTLSGSFDVNTTVFPVEYTDEYIHGMKVGQAYQFKFANTKDYILVVLRLQVTFKDGRSFQSGDDIKKFYYENLLFDYINGDYYFWHIFTPEEDWVEVGL